MKALYLFAASLFFVSISCERHDWEETKKLHEEHGHGAHDDSHAAGTDGHAGEAPDGDAHSAESHGAGEGAGAEPH